MRRSMTRHVQQIEAYLKYELNSPRGTSRRCAYLICLIILLSRANSMGQASTVSHAELKQPVIYQIGQRVHIHAAGSRPLLRAIDALQEKYGWLVNYEDAAYASAPVDDGTSPSPTNRRRANVSDVGDSDFSVEFDAGALPGGQREEEQVLTAVIDAYNEGKSKTRFMIRKEKNGTFDVIGIAAGDAGEEGSNPAPILDRPINFSVKRRSARDTLALICRQLSLAGKLDVFYNAAGSNFPQEVSVSEGGSDIPARALLSRTLEGTGGRLYWRLLYDPAAKSYELTVMRLATQEDGQEK
jgi:hypothetical protein